MFGCKWTHRWNGSRKTGFYKHKCNVHTRTMRDVLSKEREMSSPEQNLEMACLSLTEQFYLG